MNEHIRKAKGVTSDHPVSVLGDPLFFDLNESRNRNVQSDL